MRVIDVLQGPGDVTQGRRNRLQVARALGLQRLVIAQMLGP